VNPLGSELGHGGLSTQLKLSLLSVVCSSSARGGALVARISCDTHSRISVVALDVCMVVARQVRPAPVCPSISSLNVILIRCLNSLCILVLLSYAPFFL
jgi:hypothetical protein